MGRPRGNCSCSHGAALTARAQRRGEVQAKGGSVAHAHLRYLNPFPANLGELFKNYEKVLIPELNKGQLRLLIRGTYLVDALGLNKVQGKPFSVYELTNKINELLA